MLAYTVPNRLDRGRLIHHNRDIAATGWKAGQLVKCRHARRLQPSKRQLEYEGVERHFVEKAGWVSVSQLLNGVETAVERQITKLGNRALPEFMRFQDHREIHIHNEVKPIVRADAVAKAEAEAQASSEINFSVQLNGLQGGFSELKDEAAELGPAGAELLGEIETLQKRLAKLEGTDTLQQVKAAGAMSKARRVLEELNDTGTTLGKTVDKIKGGVKMAQDLGKQYNKIAEWCGLPVVPRVLLGE